MLHIVYKHFQMLVTTYNKITFPKFCLDFTLNVIIHLNQIAAFADTALVLRSRYT